MIPSEPPGLGFCLSTLIVIDLNDANEIDETPSEPSGHSFRVSTSVDNGVMIELDNAVNETPSEPPGLTRRLSCVHFDRQWCHRSLR